MGLGLRYSLVALIQIEEGRRSGSQAIERESFSVWNLWSSGVRQDVSGKVRVVVYLVLRREILTKFKLLKLCRQKSTTSFTLKNSKKIFWDRPFAKCFGRMDFSRLLFIQPPDCFTGVVAGLFVSCLWESCLAPETILKEDPGKILQL